MKRTPLGVLFVCGKEKSVLNVGRDGNMRYGTPEVTGVSMPKLWLWHSGD